MANAVRKLAPALLAVVLLPACSSTLLLSDNPKPEKAMEQVAESDVQDSAEPQESEPKQVIPPNPYLENPRPVPSAAQERFVLALAAMDKQQWKKAEEPLLQITIDYPQLSGAHLNLGICYRHLGQEKLAEDYFTQSIRANENNVEAYNWLALVKREQGEFTEAKALYEKALAVWPYHPQSHYNLGVLNELYLGDLQQARHHFSQYQKLLPEPNKRVAGWIKDLQRRIKALAENKVAP